MPRLLQCNIVENRQLYLIAVCNGRDLAHNPKLCSHSRMEDISNGSIDAISIERLNVWYEEDFIGYGRIDRPLPHPFLVDRDVEPKQVSEAGPKTCRQKSLLGSHAMLERYSVKVMTVDVLLENPVLEDGGLFICFANVVLTMKKTVP